MSEVLYVIQDVDMDDVDNIVSDWKHFNCRGDDIISTDIIDLANSIKENGLIQPITISPYNEEEQRRLKKKWRLIAGFRRYLAHKVNKAKTIRAIIRPDIITEAKARICNLAENLERKNLTILQEAGAIRALYELGTGREDMAKALGKSGGWIQIRVMLLKLPESVQRETESGLISQTDIRTLYSIYSVQGEDGVFAAVKKIKDAKIKGQKGQVVEAPNRKKPTAKMRRNNLQIFRMMDHLRQTIGVGLYSRALAWCAGEISDLDLFQSIEEYALDHNITYSIPDLESFYDTEPVA